MKTFYPTEEEFGQSPCEYIEKLIDSQKAFDYGCVKIVPPSSFKPECAFDRESDRKLLTRY